MKAKESILDLNSYLFEQLNRITNDDLKGEELRDEIERSRAVCGVAETIVKNASLALKVAQFADSVGTTSEALPDLLTGE